MKIALLLCFLLMVTSCSIGPFKPYQNAELRQVANNAYNQMMSVADDYERWIISTKAFPLDYIKMDFYEHLPSDKLGTCYIGRQDGQRVHVILINTKKWQKLSDLSKHQLMLHELGHCLGIITYHDDTELNGIPVSVMGRYFFQTMFLVEVFFTITKSL